MQEFLYRDPTRFASEYIGNTTLHPLGLASVVLASLGVVLGPRRHVPVFALLLAVFIPVSQRVVVAGIDFHFLRLLAVFALVRFLVRGELAQVRWTGVDLCLFLSTVAPAVCCVFRGSMQAILNMLGEGFDFFAYFVVGRVTLRGAADFTRWFATLAYVTVPVCIAVLIEKATGRNLFSVFGGVPEVTAFREGKLRAQGAFAHPILAGLWWACLFPVLWAAAHSAGIRHNRWICNGKWLVGLGVILLVWASASSTPIGTLALGILLTASYSVRGLIWSMRWYGLGMLACLHLFSGSGLHGLLFTKITIVAGSTGWHRYLLLDAAIKHFPEWALVGSDSTYHWGWGLDDVTSQLVLSAIRGGATGLVLLLVSHLLVVRGLVARSLKAGVDPWESRVCWGLAAGIAGVVLGMTAVSFFGQFVFLWGVLLGIGTTLGIEALPIKSASSREVVWAPSSVVTG